MSSATQTLLGLYQIGIQRNKNFFDKLTFPEGINHDLAVTNILHQAGDFEVLYPDLDFMMDACEMFSTKWQRTFEKWLEVMSIEYEPLDNYDRKEAWSDSYSESNSHSASLSSSESHSTSLSTSESHSMSGHTSTSDSTSNSTTTDNDISAFNANTLQNDTSSAVNAVTADRSSNDTQSHESDKTDSIFNEHQHFISGERDSDVKRSLGEHRGRVHGNIGVMTTQSIYREQWELQKLNIYDEIYVLFAREFLIPFSY